MRNTDHIDSERSRNSHCPLNDNDAGKAEGIHFMIGRRPIAAFGNSTTGDRQIAKAGAAHTCHPRTPR
jgi:hypothetical protein